eukprot:maker-scaffold1012_size70876-snap-gene-0.12 protein:Tk04104 transcript:maker-scaffold1012_size70876-snap-gene-0.12-mRNA-1 annotation:"PREDICTED: hypothetical protein LOC100651479"
MPLAQECGHVGWPFIGLIVIGQETTDCYNFSWRADPRSNGSCPVSKDTIHPCALNFAPFNMTMEEGLDYADKNHFFCTTGDSCISYIFYNRDQAQTPYNTTRFCGKGINVNEGTDVTKGCHTQKLPGFELEVCFCQNNFCDPVNGANNLLGSSMIQIHAMIMFSTLWILKTTLVTAM